MSYKARHRLYGWRKAKREQLAFRAHRRFMDAVTKYVHGMWDAMMAMPPAEIPTSTEQSI